MLKIQAVMKIFLFENIINNINKLILNSDMATVMTYLLIFPYITGDNNWEIDLVIK